MAQPPDKPSSTKPHEANGGGASGDNGGDNPFLQHVDAMSPQELADYLYALAEEVIASPEEYKIKMGLKQLDIAELDNIDLSTPQGRKKLAKIFRLLAEQALRGKEVYQASVVDKSKGQGRTR